MLRNFEGIDHVVLNVRDRMEEAVDRFQRLGFQLTPRGFHTLGSINHLMVFGPDYLEILGFEAGKPSPRTELVANPVGLIACALASSDSRAVYEDLLAKNIPVREPMDFSRPVELAGGRKEDARFRVTRLEPRAVEGAVLTFCEHYTRHLVWRPEWQRHANGTRQLAGAIAVVPDPEWASASYAKVLGSKNVRRDGEGVSVILGHFELELVTADTLRRRYGDYVSDGAGRSAFMAVLRLQTEAIERTKAALEAGGVAYRDGTTSVLVPANVAMGAALQFVS